MRHDAPTFPLTRISEFGYSPRTPGHGAYSAFYIITTQNKGRDAHQKSVSKAGNGGAPLVTSSLAFSHFQALECGSKHSLI
jgi:hypothetical protein